MQVILIYVNMDIYIMEFVLKLKELDYVKDYKKFVLEILVLQNVLHHLMMMMMIYIML